MYLQDVLRGHKDMDGARMNTFGPKIFDFHAWVKKGHFGNFSERLVCMKIVFFWSITFI